MTVVDWMVLVEKDTKVEEVVYTLGDAVVEIEVSEEVPVPSY